MPGLCHADLALTTERYTPSDRLFDQLEANVMANPDWRKVVEIDHSRLGQQAGSEMPPSRVLIFSNPRLETDLILQNQLVALDLPLRVLAYEDSPGGDSKLVYNRYAYLQSRYRLPQQSPLGAAYEASITQALRGVPGASIGVFPETAMEDDGIVTIESPFDFVQTLARVLAAIAGQDDTVSFGNVDFRQQAAALGVDLRSSTLILFGAPGPGARAMHEAPTMGLDAFCQKMLVWQDHDGKVYLSFNDLLTLAERQGVGKSIPLRVINFRLKRVFSKAKTRTGEGVCGPRAKRARRMVG